MCCEFIILNIKGHEYVKCPPTADRRKAGVRLNAKWVRIKRRSILSLSVSKPTFTCHSHSVLVSLRCRALRVFYYLFIYSEKQMKLLITHSLTQCLPFQCKFIHKVGIFFLSFCNMNMKLCLLNLAYSVPLLLICDWYQVVTMGELITSSTRMLGIWWWPCGSIWSVSSLVGVESNSFSLKLI